MWQKNKATTSYNWINHYTTCRNNVEVHYHMEEATVWVRRNIDRESILNQISSIGTNEEGDIKLITTGGKEM